MREAINKISNRSEISEKAIEKYLVKKINLIGGVCLKFSSQTQTGYPDRVALLPNGRLFWCELKSSGKKIRPLQAERIKQLRSLGFDVLVADNKQIIDNHLIELGFEI